MNLPYVLLVHGLDGSGPGHWQNWLAGELASRGGQVEIPRFTDPDRPELHTWLTELREHLAAAPAEGHRVVITHSLGALLWLHHCARQPDPALRVDRVLLVAPPASDVAEPRVRSFLPPPLDPAGLRRAAGGTRLVTGTGDPYCTDQAAAAYAAALGVEHDVIPGGAHLNIDAGYGPWPAVLSWARTGHTPLVGR
ncbi:RBBP9/YdeN family alpha/beta hydrolase [Goodfellowiella coeruleoviolacea]|uniref:Hydrolase n=1 Tax=Goodfellowiella coeruleoviolacea TaxID=334858 RepID=A0AAE3GBA8_9PSEU|nr:alpha/beta hydrolase [Goodfellowiella coeruleoviolacea]MCP2165091.1 hypothetical protein [Goodfellowiella coeruleoviolacea]